MKRLFGILLWALFCLFGTQLSFGQNNREQVLALQRQAIELMDNGDPDQGIVLLRQALTLDSPKPRGIPMRASTTSNS